MSAENMLLKDLDWLRENILSLLNQHSAISKREGTQHGGVVIVSSRQHSWHKLSIEGKRLQNEIRNRFKKFSGLYLPIIETYSPEDSKEVQSFISTIRELFEQKVINSMTEYPSIENASKEVIRGFETLKGIFEDTPTGLKEFEGRHLLIVDTSSLLHEPQLDLWRFENIERAMLVIIPQVISEVDKHAKSENEDLRKKANSIIKQIRDYRNRGALQTGAKVNGRLDVHITTTNHLNKGTYDWLDSRDGDDSILLSVIDLIVIHFRSTIAMVTRDTNMTNKLALLGICTHLPSVETPKKSVRT